MKLVEDWKDAWRWFSTQAMVLSGAIVWLEPHLPMWREYLPEDIYKYLAITVLAAGVVGRLLPQKSGSWKDGAVE